jgi:paraquat-inducible protein A
VFGSTERALLIRVLVVASLVLLVTGAVSPLLTTERFYFFSNTFSLISGLQQLVANDQLLLAVVVCLFSLCVPIVKAVVIWTAASPGASRSRLLVLAERFGKWSMLEVFIAALLIIALKLGPVVDATLHYGAWLLAASVLLSGVASQFLAHEPHDRTVFSNPVTLTIGAVGGAVSATVLIALLNPGLLNIEALVGTPESRCVQRVLRLDRLYASSTDAQSDYVSNLRTIESGVCPDSFRGAFDDYIEAWEQLDSIDADDVAEPSLLDRASALLGLTATRDEALEEIEEAWAEIERIALEHGVTAPPK